MLAAGSVLLPRELHARTPVGMVAEHEDMVLPVLADGRVREAPAGQA